MVSSLVFISRSRTIVKTDFLLYRRLPIGWALPEIRRSGQGAVLQDGILRYSRLAVCATNTAVALLRYTNVSSSNHHLAAGAARTRTLESVRYVARPFQAAGSRSFPAPQRAPARVGPWWEYKMRPIALTSDCALALAAQPDRIAHPNLSECGE